MQEATVFYEEYKGFRLVARYDRELRNVWSGYIQVNDERNLSNDMRLYRISEQFAQNVLRLSGRVYRVTRYEDPVDYVLINGIEYGKLPGANRCWTGKSILDDLKDIVDSL